MLGTFMRGILKVGRMEIIEQMWSKHDHIMSYDITSCRVICLKLLPLNLHICILKLGLFHTSHNKVWLQKTWQDLVNLETFLRKLGRMMAYRIDLNNPVTLNTFMALFIIFGVHHPQSPFIFLGWKRAKHLILCRTRTF